MRIWIVFALVCCHNGAPRESIAIQRVLSAFEQADIQVREIEHRSGEQLHATSCVIGRMDGVGISICDFASDEDAKRGRALALQVFDFIPNKTLVLKRRTLLTVRRFEQSRDAEAQAQAIVTAFERL